MLISGLLLYCGLCGDAETMQYSTMNQCVLPHAVHAANKFAAALWEAMPAKAQNI